MSIDSEKAARRKTGRRFYSSEPERPKNPLTEALLLRVINPAAQRYTTVGDWQGGQPIKEQVGTVISVSDMENPDYAFLVGLHELVEWYLRKRAGVSEETVDAFDMTPLREGYAEHGDDPTAPYHRQHEVAGVVERLVAHELGVDWYEYACAIDAASDKSEAAQEEADDGEEVD